MTLRLKISLLVASLALVTIALRCLWLWQPERQVLLHQRTLRLAVEKRNWNRINALVDTGYSDRWGYTRQTGIAEARQWLSQFFALTIIPTGTTVAMQKNAGTVKERWRAEGTGTEASSLVRERLNGTEAPFTFQWRRAGWQPWAWTLVRVDNPQLDLADP